MVKKILVVAKEWKVRKWIAGFLTDAHPKWRIDMAKEGQQALEMILKADYDLVLTDIKMPHKSGLELLKDVRKQKPQLPIVIITDCADVPTVVAAMKAGARDYLKRPIDPKNILDSIAAVLDNAKRNKEQKHPPNQGVSKSQGVKADFPHIIGNSKIINDMKNRMGKVASKDVRVLILGQNGSGKELVAKGIHTLSHRSKGQIVEVNCAAIPSELIESELFGHVKGAFTGAITNKVGHFEAAHDGTIFLDEIGDMSLPAQAKVLRVLEENIVTPVGSSKKVPVNVRVIAATNKDLKKEIAKGTFREDLFHRLSMIKIRVPALKERLDDIPLLVAHFTRQVAKELQLDYTPKFSDKTMALLKKRAWTGNVRELRNVVYELIVFGGAFIDVNPLE